MCYTSELHFFGHGGGVGEGVIEDLYVCMYVCVCIYIYIYIYREREREREREVIWNLLKEN